jgi:hypothetical protein
LDLLKSLIWPSNAIKTSIKRIAIFALLAQSTGSTSNPFINSLFPYDVSKAVAAQKSFYDPAQPPVLTVDPKFMDYVPIDRPYITGDISKTIAPGKFPNIMTLFDPYFNGMDYNFYYAMYHGSYTTPPCFEDVIWIVGLLPIRVNEYLIS